MSNETQETPKTPKKASTPKKAKVDPVLQLAAQVGELTLRVEKLESQNTIIVDGFEFAANETRPLFGFGAFAVIFDAIVKKLRA